MSEDIKNKVKQTFVDSISVKQEIFGKELYKVLIEAGDIIANSIANGSKLLLWGNGGGEALQCCDPAFVVPVNTTARIQESHISAGHSLSHYIEDFYWREVG
jgi:phosphoheptose isomerase